MENSTIQSSPLLKLPRELSHIILDYVISTPAAYVAHKGVLSLKLTSRVSRDLTDGIPQTLETRMDRLKKLAKDPEERFISAVEDFDNHRHLTMEPLLEACQINGVTESDSIEKVFLTVIRNHAAEAASYWVA